LKKYMRSELIPNGEFVTIDGHRMHIFRTGNVNRPKRLIKRKAFEEFLNSLYSV